MPKVNKIQSKSQKIKEPSAKTAKEVPAKKAETKSGVAQTRVQNTASLSVPVYSLVGKEDGTLTLPQEIFGQKVNKSLLAQAIRVYATNQKTFTASTKTRGEVEGSTVKIYRQKGTGRARHGAIRAPIFVGGGIIFGPKPRKVRLNMPQNMKRAALISAVSSKAAEKQIVGVSGTKEASGKTKEMADFIKKLSVINNSSLAAKNKKPKAKSILFVTAQKQDNMVKAVRNIPGVSVLPASYINAYEVLRHELLLLTKEAAGKIGKPIESKTPVTVIASVAKQSSSENKKIATGSSNPRNDKRGIKK